METLREHLESREDDTQDYGSILICGNEKPVLVKWKNAEENYVV